MLKTIKTFLRDEDAATAVEYAVLIALILVVIIGGLTATGGGTNQWWQNIGTEMTTFGM